MRELRHFSNKPVLAARTVTQRNPEDPILVHTKPRGLWVSDESSEESGSRWCEAESFGLGKIEHAVLLAPGASILYIESVAELDDFAKSYGVFSERSPFRDEPSIQWADVARDYDGILISPYQWERRLHHGSSWYYGWDCASGCIWRSRAISNIEPVKAPREGAAILEASAS